MPTFTYQQAMPYFNISVATSETVCYSHLIKLLLAREKSMFITGVTGVGKTMLVE